MLGPGIEHQGRLRILGDAAYHATSGMVCKLIPREGRNNMRIDSTSGPLRLARTAFLVLGLSATIGCGDDDDDGTNAGGSSGTPGTGDADSGAGSSDEDAGGSDGEECVVGCSYCPQEDPPFDDPYCINLKCPAIEPLNGDLAQKGACCYRMPAEVAAKETLRPGEGGPLSFVMSYFKPVSQPLTLGSAGIAWYMSGSQELGYEVLLLRINGVIPEDDAPPGPIDVTIEYGSGRQHCDGTYSFYGKGAAPDYEGRTDADRWYLRKMTGTWDWSAEPYLSINDEGRYFGLDWLPRWLDTETINYEQPMRMVDIDLDLIFDRSYRDEENNCVGQRFDDGTWKGPPAVTLFIPMQEADQTVTRIASQTLCSIVANHIGTRDSDKKPFTCEGPRVGGINPWLELPDSICPIDPPDESKCWIGVKDHPDFKAERDCNGADRPCCDPTGKDTDGLEACNSWFVTAEVMLASVLVRTVDDNGKKWIWRDNDYPASEEFITDPALAPPQKCGN